MELLKLIIILIFIVLVLIIMASFPIIAVFASMLCVMVIMKLFAE